MGPWSIRAAAGEADELDPVVLGIAAVVAVVGVFVAGSYFYSARTAALGIAVLLVAVALLRVVAVLRYGDGLSPGTVALLLGVVPGGAAVAGTIATSPVVGFLFVLPAALLAAVALLVGVRLFG